MRRLRPLLLSAALLLGAVPATGAAANAAPAQAGAGGDPRPLDQVIPAPASVRAHGDPFTLTDDTRIRVGGHAAAARGARDAAQELAEILRPSTGYDLPVTTRGDAHRGSGAIVLAHGGPRSLGEEGYRLRVGEQRVVLQARAAAGFFHGVQTLRQLLPAQVESDAARTGTRTWRIAGGTLTDTPRFEHRGAMLDVSRHFFTVEEVKRYIDQLALYKFNRLHLHLSDDQGWRIAIDSWPRLATHGGSTEVGGGPGGYYTKAEYREILRYADDHQLMVVPEIDMPGHTNAALASYAELNCDGVAPPLYTGIEVGFSSLCVPLERTYDFVDDVVREIAAMTPGPYLHIGGDEAHSTSHEDYVAFMDRAQAVVGKYGKTVVGWHQLTGAEPAEDAVVQYWGVTGEEEDVADAARNGNRLVLSPADRVYLDMKYNEDTPLGLSWAGYVEVRQSYDWDPGRYFQGVPESAVLGVEAPLWSETLENSDHIEYMAFPRLPGVAELGWSPAATHDWEDYRVRLAAQAPRWEALGIDYYRSPQVPWDSGTR
ncbi:beta-N-acetylhexosaminidase [Streptomyces sp. DSM 42041]|uniref:beta-N-acetylhexosaminidase n=1 Tax=Streptomyces hazeniae TaxID=3075538 RepID=A0ABU2NLC2_9ACTN|nr:beta-N-acetylhexosaminidase [Streptomyces sp. DSM 42041]MDT0377765.1 beta-N-acetylhexosaminidase [Streptomyces sp. DSM 42041]